MQASALERETAAACTPGSFSASALILLAQASQFIPSILNVAVFIHRLPVNTVGERNLAPGVSSKVKGLFAISGGHFFARAT